MKVKQLLFVRNVFFYFDAVFFIMLEMLDLIFKKDQTDLNSVMFKNIILLVVHNKIHRFKLLRRNHQMITKFGLVAVDCSSRSSNMDFLHSDTQIGIIS